MLKNTIEFTLGFISSLLVIMLFTFAKSFFVILLDDFLIEYIFFAVILSVLYVKEFIYYLKKSNGIKRYIVISLLLYPFYFIIILLVNVIVPLRNNITQIPFVITVIILSILAILFRGILYRMYRRFIEKKVLKN